MTVSARAQGRLAVVAVVLVLIAACGGSEKTGREAFGEWYEKEMAGTGPEGKGQTAETGLEVADDTCDEFDDARVRDSYILRGTDLLDRWNNSRGAARVIEHAVDDVCQVHEKGLEALSSLGTNWDRYCDRDPEPVGCT
jgi:hypothetical protein